MCIYCGTSNYRKIYENHHGKILRDNKGRSFDIHHIDGNHNNNCPFNLKALSIIKHFYTHLSQGDWWAAAMVGSRAGIDSRLVSALLILGNTKKYKKLEYETNNFLVEKLIEETFTKKEKSVYQRYEKTGHKKKTGKYRKIKYEGECAALHGSKLEDNPHDKYKDWASYKAWLCGYREKTKKMIKYKEKLLKKNSII